MIASVCLEPCLSVCNEHIARYCRPVTVLPESPSSSMHTWVPDNSDLVFIVKSRSSTLLYLPRTDRMYYAHPLYALAPSCAENTIFRSQFVVDHGCTPRLLVFDMVSDGGESLQGAAAQDRYRLLQERVGCLQQPHCVLQWVGEQSAMDKAFFAGLPHKVRTHLTLTEDPLSLYIHGVALKTPCALRDSDSGDAAARMTPRRG